MFSGHGRPILSPDYAAAARKRALDLAAAFVLLVSASIMAGRVWRFPFDDELIALAPIERSHSAIELLTRYLTGGDIHPPLSFLLFYLLHGLGLSEAGIRLCSLAMTAVALALFHVAALTLLARRNAEAVSPATRLIAVLLFGLSALAIGQGDAIRWYPLFAMLIALFVTLYLFGGSDAARLGSAVFLGLAASTNFLAILVAAPFALYRYGLQRQFRAPFDIAFGLAVLVFAIPGIVSAYAIFAGPLGGPMLAAYGGGVMRIVASDLLGFFGGDALGIRQAWILVPALAISALATIAAIDRREPASPVHLLLLLLAATVLMAPASFAQPRSFLYLAPVMAAVVTLFLDRQARQRAAVTVLMVSLLLAASVGSIANINGGSHPFKRNAAIPYQSIVDFIDSNGSGSDLVISTDPVIPWVLAHRANHGELCASYFVAAPGCFAADKRYDAVFVISGYSDKSGRPAAMRRFATAVAQATAGRRKLATLHAGVDEDADLKTRLTGVALDKYILTVELYR